MFFSLSLSWGGHTSEVHREEGSSHQGKCCLQRGQNIHSLSGTTMHQEMPNNYDIMYVNCTCTCTKILHYSYIVHTLTMYIARV